MPVRRSGLIHVLHGLLMGTADAIPGVSGGTIALVVGIYERLIHSIEAGFRGLISLVRLDVKGSRPHLRQVEWRLVLPLAVGIATALLVAARFVPDLLERYPSQSRALFLGMVAASIPIPWKRMSPVSDSLTLGRRPIELAAMAAAAVLAFVLTGLPPGSIAEPALWQVLMAAAVAICAMILPGISGAFLLLALGMYEPSLRAVDDRDLVYVGVFMIGAAAGLGSFSILLSRLLARHHDLTMVALVGLMAGSLRALWPWQGPDRELLAPDSNLAAAVGLALAGLALVAGIERVSRTRAIPE